MGRSYVLTGLAAALATGFAASGALAAADPLTNSGISQTGPSAGANYTNAQLAAFSKLHEEMLRAEAQGRSDTGAANAALAKSGLTMAQYNDIVARLKTDPALAGRVQEVAKASGIDAGAASAPPSGASTSAQPVAR